MTKPFVDNMRRDSNEEKLPINTTMQKWIVDLAKEYDIESRRGGGNMGAATEQGLLLLIGIFDKPDLAHEVIMSLIEKTPHLNDAILDVADNLEMIAKMLYDDKL